MIANLAARATVAVIGVAATLLVFGLGWNAIPQPTVPQVTWIDGYELDSEPIAAAGFPGNELVVLADVVATLPARWNVTRSAEPGEPTFIFTPVRVRIIEVLRGTPRLQAGEMVIRRLGGRVGDVEYAFDPGIAPPGLEPGNRVLLFLGEQKDIGDGLDSATPNLAYVIDTRGNAISWDGRWSLGLADFRELVRSTTP